MTTLICCQPVTLYYAWQVEVMLKSFVNNGINLNHVDIVCAVHEKPDMEAWTKLANSYPARFFFYKDDRPQPLYYISSVRPWILAKHFANHPYLQNNTIFYHDCDIALTKPINFFEFTKDELCYGSDVRSYISHSYIKTKGQEVMDLMCQIVGVHEKLIEENELNCVGAQYVLKNIDQEFWLKVYNDSEALFKQVTALNNVKKKINPNYHELQIWCADMWAVLWNIWKRGQKTVVSPELSFSWATSTEHDWNKNAIFHNAGVTATDHHLFFKGNYQHRLPFNESLNIQDGTASKKYYELIQSVDSVLCK